jgi:hypothetical protein
MSDMLMPSKISSMFNAAVGIQEKYALKNSSHQLNPRPTRAMPFPIFGASHSFPSTADQSSAHVSWGTQSC